jgi:hypothetical protein
MGTMFGITVIGLVIIGVVGLVVGIITSAIDARRDKRAARKYLEHRAEFDRKYGAEGQRRPRATEGEEDQ